MSSALEACLEEATKRFNSRNGTAHQAHDSAVSAANDECQTGEGVAINGRGTGGV